MTWAATTLKCITKGFHLLRITYISEESKPFSISALLELLQQCHINNPRLGLTGLLIYGNGTFNGIFGVKASKWRHSSSSQSWRLESIAALTIRSFGSAIRC
ncbi:MAG: hypothetical protein EBX17_05705 [Betaproteobacteria bacterium]|nr:hypothetical protein [Betaproteobacteria bacterium]